MTDLNRLASDIRNKFHKTRLTKEFHYAFDPDDVYAVIEALERAAVSGEIMRRDVAEAIMESQYRAGMKARWNFCATDDDERYQAVMRYEGHLKPIMEQRSAAKPHSTSKE